MNRSLRGSVLVLTTVLGLAGLAAPGQSAEAQADAFTATVSAGPGVLFAECTDHPISYSVTPPLTVLTWNIQLSFQAPDGTSAGSAYISKGDPTTGIETKRFCGGSDLPGTYTVTGTYEVTDQVGNKYPKTLTPVTPFTFDLRLPYSAVTAKPSTKKPRLGQHVKVNATVTDERPSGAFFGTSNASAQLQRLKGSKWVNVKGARDYTKVNGRAQLRYRHTWKGKTTFRVLSDLGKVGTAVSENFTLKAGKKKAGKKGKKGRR
ncbi:hypothetical protein [Nocardioides campestrisoli]|uniref:hypothetical protein n=1 Tax=Nocardioides campestrisoli TaxID=2736757 RepID=UPI00163D5A57|nr:hypothetical protein [Nocardioides campestrisoli]